MRSAVPLYAVPLPSISLPLGAKYGYKFVLTIIGIIAIVAAAMILIVPYEGKDRQPLTFEKFKLEVGTLFAVSLVPYTIFTGLFSFNNSLITNYLSLLCDEKGITNYTAYFTVHAVSMFAVKAIGGKITDKKGLTFTLIPAYIVAAFAMFMIGSAATASVIVAMGVVTSIGMGLGQPALQAECVKRMSKDQRGLATSMYYLGADFFQGIGPIAGGAIVDATGSYSPAYFAGCMVLTMGLFSYILFDRTVRSKEVKTFQ